MFPVVFVLMMSLHGLQVCIISDEKFAIFIASINMSFSLAAFKTFSLSFLLSNLIVIPWCHFLLLGIC